MASFFSFGRVSSENSNVPAQPQSSSFGASFRSGLSALGVSEETLNRCENRVERVAQECQGQLNRCENRLRQYQGQMQQQNPTSVVTHGINLGLHCIQTVSASIARNQEAAIAQRALEDDFVDLQEEPVAQSNSAADFVDMGSPAEIDTVSQVRNLIALMDERDGLLWELMPLNQMGDNSLVLGRKAQIENVLEQKETELNQLREEVYGVLSQDPRFMSELEKVENSNPNRERIVLQNFLALYSA